MTGTADVQHDPAKASQPEAATSPRVTVVAACNDDAVLGTNLAASPVIRSGRWSLVTEHGHASAGAAYNAGMQRVDDADWIVFAHQDVYLPAGWDERLLKAIGQLGDGKPAAAILGVVGVNEAGRTLGRSWSTGLGREVGRVLARPEAVMAVDEMVFVLNMRAGLRFDERLPGYHLYGTDVATHAIEQGWGVYVFDGPLVHNSVPVTNLWSDYRRAYRYMQRKWRARLPLRTCVVPVTRFGWPLMRWQLRRWRRWRAGVVLRQQPRHADPASLAERLGYTQSA